MLLTSPSFLRHVYAKTLKGQDEIVRPKFGLNPRQRRILVFVDGVKALSALRETFPAQEMEDIITVLSGHHFIRLVGERQEELSFSTQKHSACFGCSAHDAAPAPRLTAHPDKIRKAREFMLETAAIHLGILGRDIVQKIEAADGAAPLASLAGQWTMALCASKTAARYAQLYLEQLKWILFDEQTEYSDSHSL